LLHGQQRRLAYRNGSQWSCESDRRCFHGLTHIDGQHAISTDQTQRLVVPTAMTLSAPDHLDDDLSLDITHLTANFFVTHPSLSELIAALTRQQLTDEINRRVVLHCIGHEESADARRRYVPVQTHP
jgi:Zn-dependent protease with chaperone function